MPSHCSGSNVEVGYRPGQVYLSPQGESAHYCISTYSVAFYEPGTVTVSRTSHWLDTLLSIGPCPSRECVITDQGWNDMSI